MIDFRALGIFQEINPLPSVKFRQRSTARHHVTGAPATLIYARARTAKQPDRRSEKVEMLPCITFNGMDLRLT